MLCELSSFAEGDGNSEYGVCEDVPIGEEIRRATFKVCYDEDAKEVRCNCRLFQFRGILCRHAITVLVHKKVYKIKDKYILKRWIKVVKRCHTRVKISYDDWSTKPEARRFDKMCVSFYELADMARDSEDKSNKDFQTRGLHDFGHSNMVGRYVPSNMDCQTQGTHGFGHQNVGEGFWQPNMVGGYGTMLQHFDTGNEKQPLFYDLAARNPTMNPSLSNDKD
ncbi:hypothetical protein LguiB_005472 [Lonicera macranthoides]